MKVKSNGHAGKNIDRQSNHVRYRNRERTIKLFSWGWVWKNVWFTHPGTTRHRCQSVPVSLRLHGWIEEIRRSILRNQTTMEKGCSRTAIQQAILLLLIKKCNKKVRETQYVRRIQQDHARATTRRYPWNNP